MLMLRNRTTFGRRHRLVFRGAVFVSYSIVRVEGVFKIGASSEQLIHPLVSLTQEGADECGVCGRGRR